MSTEVEDYVRIPGVKAAAQNDKALRCVLPDGRSVWVPSAQIHDDSEVTIHGHSGDLVVRGEFARSAGIAPTGE